MAGKKCPKCQRMTFLKTKGLNRKCSQCGYGMRVPPNKGKGGPGSKCINCGKLRVFNNVCNNCGAIYG